MMMVEGLVLIPQNEFKATSYGVFAEPLLLRSVALFPWLLYEPLNRIHSAFLDEPSFDTRDRYCHEVGIK